MVKVKIFERSG